MDSSRGYYAQFTQQAFVWKPAFSKRRTAQYIHENNRYVQIAIRSFEEPTSEDSTDSISTEDVVDRFVNNKCQLDLDRYLYRTDKLVNFLEAASMEDLRGPATPPVSKIKVLIDDRNNAIVTREVESFGGSRRASQGSFDARGLYSELLKPRTELHGQIDAERRLVYITDLDSYCGLALAATVSRTQAASLRDFMHTYLDFRALIGVYVSTVEHANFSLILHLPYYAWRRSRPISSNTSSHIRRSEEVIHLEMNTHQSLTGEDDDDSLKDYIHEAQISILVTGLDEWFWTAYCLVNVYFRGDNHSERVEQYAYASPPMDPHSCGKFPADRPIWDPRHYFLRALCGRMEQVKQEWNNAISQLFQEIQPCIYTFTRSERLPGGATELEITQQPGFKWTIRILRQFTHVLSKTIDAWQTFKDGELRYFTLPDSEVLAQASWGDYLAAIDKDVTELRTLRSSVIFQTELFENMTNSIVTHAAHAETITTRVQSEFVQALTVITILYLPATLASTIFSMQLLPKGVSLKEWGYTLGGLTLLTFFLVMNLPHITQWGRPIRTWQDRMWNKLYQFLYVNSGFRTRIQRRNGIDDGV